MPPQAASADANPGLFAQHWRPAPVVPAGLTILPGAVAQRTAVDDPDSDSQTLVHGSISFDQASDPQRLEQLSRLRAATHDTAAEDQASDSQTAAPLALFALDVVLWPNQLMMLR